MVRAGADGPGLERERCFVVFPSFLAAPLSLDSAGVRKTGGFASSPLSEFAFFSGLDVGVGPPPEGVLKGIGGAWTILSAESSYVHRDSSLVYRPIAPLILYLFDGLSPSLVLSANDGLRSFPSYARQTNKTRAPRRAEKAAVRHPPKRQMTGEGHQIDIDFLAQLLYTPRKDFGRRTKTVHSRSSTRRRYS